MDLVNGVPATAGHLRELALTGYGHFTTMRVAGGGVPGLMLHLERLARDCRAVFGTEPDPERVRALARQAGAGVPQPYLLRVTAFDPDLDVARPGHAPAGAPGEPHLLLSTRPAPPPGLPPLRLASVPALREFPHIKHSSLFAQLRHRRGAQLDGFDDALLTSPAGEIAEGPTWNIVLHDGRGPVWPSAPALPGVTATLLRDAFPEAVTRPVTLDELPGMRAAFATSCGIGVRAVAAVDGTALDPAPELLHELRAALDAVPAEPF